MKKCGKIITDGTFIELLSMIENNISESVFWKCRRLVENKIAAVVSDQVKSNIQSQISHYMDYMDGLINKRI